MTAVLEAEHLAKSYPTARNLLGRQTGSIRAVDDVSFDVPRGQTLAVVGESGAGKSTVGRLVLRLVEPDAGAVRFLGEDVLAMSGRELRGLRRRAQMIFQDPFSSLDPRMVVGDAVAEPLALHTDLDRTAREQRVLELLDNVGMGPEHVDRYPHEFSGGQLQRIAIARALATDPELIVCDEPTAALDVSIQAQVINLLIELQRERDLAYLFISHDLSLVRILATEVTVMRHGRIVEHQPTARLFERPEQEYTERLLSAIPVATPRRPRKPIPSATSISAVLKPERRKDP